MVINQFGEICSNIVTAGGLMIPPPTAIQPGTNNGKVTFFFSCNIFLGSGPGIPSWTTIWPRSIENRKMLANWVSLYPYLTLNLNVTEMLTSEMNF